MTYSLVQLFRILKRCSFWSLIYWGCTWFRRDELKRRLHAGFSSIDTRKRTKET